MNKELLKHIEILKTVPEIRNNIINAKFGTIIQDIHTKDYYIISWKINIKWVNVKPYHCRYRREKFLTFEEIKIIWQIHEWHLRMFFDSIRWDFNFFINIEPCWNIVKEFRCKKENKTILILDNARPYQEQSEEFFKKLNNWLIKEFNINI